MNDINEVLVMQEVLSEVLDIFKKYKLPLKERIAYIEFLKYQSFKELADTEMVIRK